MNLSFQPPDSCILHLESLGDLQTVDLLIYFSKYGQIKGGRVASDGSQKGTVEFETPSQVQKAYEDGLKIGCMGLSQHCIKDKIVTCDINLDYKGEMRSREGVSEGESTNQLPEEDKDDQSKGNQPNDQVRKVLCTLATKKNPFYGHDQPKFSVLADFFFFLIFPKSCKISCFLTQI